MLNFRKLICSSILLLPIFSPIGQNYELRALIIILRSGNSNKYYKDNYILNFSIAISLFGFRENKNQRKEEGEGEIGNLDEPKGRGGGG